MSLNLTLNGQLRVFDGLAPEASLSDLVGVLGLQADRIALELNGEIISRGRWQATRLGSGDKLEMVHFVGGGSDAPCVSCDSMAESRRGCLLNPAFYCVDKVTAGQMVLR